MIWHPTLENRWQALPEHQQVLMICNELNRAENFQSDSREYKNALERALELMDFTIDDPRTRPRMREILRARQSIASFYVDPVPHGTKDLQRALMQLVPSAWMYMKQ